MIIRWVIQDIGAAYQRKLSGINDGGHRVLKGNTVQSDVVGAMITCMVDNTQDATRLEGCCDLAQKTLRRGRIRIVNVMEVERRQGEINTAGSHV